MCLVRPMGTAPCVTPLAAALPADPGETSSVADVIADLEQAGYHGQWRVLADVRIECLTCCTIVRAADVPVEAVRRAEGASDPDDMAIAFDLVCPVCDTRGTLIAGYGPETSAEDAAVLVALAPERS